MRLAIDQEGLDCGSLDTDTAFSQLDYDVDVLPSDAELETPPVPLGASAAAGNLHAEVSLAGGDWSRGADALAPAFAGVLGELAPISR